MVSLTVVTFLYITFQISYSATIWRKVLKINRGVATPSAPDDWYFSGSSSYGSLATEEASSHISSPSFSWESGNFRSRLIDEWKNNNLANVEAVKLGWCDNGNEEKFIIFDTTTTATWNTWLDPQYIISSSWTGGATPSFGIDVTAYWPNWSDRYFGIWNEIIGCADDKAWFFVSTATYCSGWNEGNASPQIFYSKGSTATTFTSANEGEAMIMYLQLIVTPSPTKNPTPSPTKNPTPSPTKNPTPSPTKNPTPSPTENPTPSPSQNPTPSPSQNPTPSPSQNPTPSPSQNPTPAPSLNPTPSPTNNPTPSPTQNPTPSPTKNPTPSPTQNPTPSPTNNPSQYPTNDPSQNPIISPTNSTRSPTTEPTAVPTADPTTADGVAYEDNIINVTTSQTPNSIDAANIKSDATTLTITIISVALILVCTVFVCVICCKRMKSREVTKEEGMITNQIEMNKKNEQYETGNNVKNAADMDIINAVNGTNIGNDNKKDIDNDIVKTINNTSIGYNNPNQTRNIGYNGDGIKNQLPPIIPPVVVTDFGGDNIDDLEEYSQESQHKDTLGGVTHNNCTIYMDDGNTIIGEDDVNVGE